MLSVGVCFVAGAIGSYFTFPSINSWYLNLHKPFFNPPNFIFGPVWSTLYLIMGVALYIILTKKNSKAKREGLKYFFIQLGLNSLWSILFFGFHNPLLAFIDILLLWLTILITMRYFLLVSRTSGLLLVPYIIWVSFAVILNLAIIVLNS